MRTRGAPSAEGGIERAGEGERSEAAERAGEAREPASSMTDDERFMQRALDLAARARGLTSPNPMVGAVARARWRDDR